jgi:predicted 2-oxoglutarate/Fe(II)-dependent dioxygenase YbiX
VNGPVLEAPAFLEPAMCRRIREAMSRGTADHAEILAATFEHQPDVRRALTIEVAPALVDDIERRLDGQRRALEAFFGLAMGEREGASFLRYDPGGFYKPHRDRGMIAGWPGAARRQTAVVVFLNSSRAVDQQGSFSGGALQLFADRQPLDIHPVEGLLVAFSAEVLHQVTRVEEGTRDTIVDWFYQP